MRYSVARQRERVCVVVTGMGDYTTGATGAVPLAGIFNVSEKQSFRISKWCIKKRAAAGSTARKTRQFCPKGIMFILFAPTGQDPYSQGQRPWIGLGAGSAL
uniref:Uncharacterized protein n=1 Tax=Candidatus Kentrum sp. DK TaxID=2126562 RepID=A0A450SCV1_9GAMM|nr:MAG: hypothetical protein BECKDK2373C_GA0170839_102820 [Candidatus Kentron sp. DK]